MANEFQSSLDIANRALQHLGAKRINPQLGFQENSKQASEMSFAYDKLRVAELRRNTWRFATRRAPIRPVNSIAIQSTPFVINPAIAGTPVSPTMLIAPAMWSASTTYTLGALVTDVSGYIWMSQQPANVNNTPGQSAAWEQYFGPMTADQFDTSGKTAYFAGDLVYNSYGVGYQVFQSLMSGNSASPTVPLPWSATSVYAMDDTAIVYPNWAVGTTYAAGAGVLYTDGNYYASLAAGNVGNTPSSSPTKWAPFPVTLVSSTGQFLPQINEWSQLTVYATGNFVDYGGGQYVAVAGSTGVVPSGNPASWAAVSTTGTVYQSLIDLNLNNAPASSPTQWSTTVTSGTGGATWKLLNVTLQQLGIVYPLGSGPSWQAQTRNAFRLPAGFLRPCSQDPRAGGVSIVGAPTNLPYTDWEYEDGYLVSREGFPIVLRFIANVTQVTKMDAMFCEGLAARLAYELCEAITQSTARKAEAAQAYQKFMSEARLVSAVEIGPEEPPLDDYLACRL